MFNLFRSANNINRVLNRNTPLNPKTAYSTVKGVVRRGLRDACGIEYSPDAKSVNIAVADVGLLLCGIPKVGTRTFIQELVFDHVLGKQVSVHSDLLYDLLSKKPVLQDYYKVAVVRNPWARVVSAYNSKICHPRLSSVRTFFIRYQGLHYRMPFDEFIDWLCNSDEGRDDVADRHWISQHRFLYDGDDLLVDRVGRLEAFDEMFSEVCEHLKIEPVILGNHSRKTTEGGKSYRDSFDERTKAMVARRYAKDIELFDYEF